MPRADAVLITDSPYRTGELVLAPLTGLLAGFVGSAMVLGGMAVLRPSADSTIHEFLALITGRSVFNLFVYFGLGGLGGLLYALCEQRGPRPALMVVGLYYGFVVWVVGGVMGEALLGPTARSVLHSWQLLLAGLAFGLWLAVVALWSASRHVAAPDEPQD